MTQSLKPQQQLGEDEYIRAKMFAGGRSRAGRYANLVVGPDATRWQLLKYELITGLFGGLPGAVGLVLRQMTYSSLFRRVGKGLVVGRHVVVRNAHNIELGDNVVIDDGCVLDGRGAGEQGVVIGDRVIIGRHSTIQAKIGPIRIGADCDIGEHAVIHAQGGVEIGTAVVLGGGCKISGGAFQTDRGGAAAGTGQAGRGQTRWTRGPIRIADRCLIGMGAMLLDGVELGEGVILGAGSIVTRSLPASVIAAGAPAKVLRRRTAVD